MEVVMAITKTINSKGIERFSIRVEARGRNRSLRAFRNHVGCTSISEAHLLEKKLFRECHDEIRTIELRGILWGDLVKEWYQYTLEMRALNPNVRLSREVLEDYQSILRKWTGHLFGRPCSELGADDFEDVFYKLDLSEASRPHKVKLKRLITEVFSIGHRKQLIPRLNQSPVEKIQVGGIRVKRTEILTLSQVSTLIQSALNNQHLWGRVWAFAYLSLMRSQEIYALQWANINFEDKHILVNKSFSIKAKRLGLSGLKDTKTSDWHYVPINEDLFTLLQIQRGQTGGTEFVFERSTEWETNKLARGLRKYCAELGLPSICFHSLRACGATHLIQQGLEPAKVMKLGGWKSLKSMEHYIRQSGIDVKGLNENHRILFRPNVAVIPFVTRHAT